MEKRRKMCLTYFNKQEDGKWVKSSDEIKDMPVDIESWKEHKKFVVSFGATGYIRTSKKRPKEVEMFVSYSPDRKSKVVFKDIDK